MSVPDYKTPTVITGVVSRIGSVTWSADGSHHIIFMLENSNEVYAVDSFAYKQAFPAENAFAALTKIGDTVEVSVYIEGSANSLKFKNITLMNELGGSTLTLRY